MPTPKEEIETSLSEPKKVMIDGDTVENYDLDAQVKAAEYLDKKNAQQQSKLGFLRFKIKPGSSL